MKRIINYTLALLFATMQTFAQTYTYDNLNRLTKVVYSNGTTITYSFDALGNRTSKTVSGVSTETYTITTSVTPSGSGTVTGSGTYSKGTTIELKAVANAGYEFSKWSDGVTDNPRSVTVTQNKSYTAQFTEAAAETYTISVAVTPSGSGTVTGGGTYSKGTTIVLKAIANTGYTFSKWGDGVTDNPRSVTVTQNKSYTALFDESALPTDKWYLVAHKAEGGSQDFAMDNVGSLVAIDDATDFSVLDVSGNVLASRIIKVTFRHGDDDDAVETLRQPDNFIGGMVNGKLTIVGVKGPVAVYDISGVRHILVEAQGDETVVNVSNLPTGIYVVRVGQQSFKFIKK